MISQQTLRTETTDRAPRSTQNTEFFEGLPDGVKHTDLLRLVQNLEKKIGLSSAAVLHLEYLVTHTREVDWQPGAVPIVYRSVQNTATDRRRTERQIHNLEKALHQAGLIRWNDTENYKRYGRRDRHGHIEFAYGVDLTPLGLMYERLVELNDRHMAYMAAFTETKRKVSALRRRIRNKLRWLEELNIDVEDLNTQFEDVPRIHAGMTITILTDILNQVRQISSQLDDLLQEHRHQKPSMAEEVEAEETGCGSKQTSDTYSQQSVNNL